MPGRDIDAAEGDVPPRPSAWQRGLNAMLKPAEGDRDGSGTGAKSVTDGPSTVPELEEAVKRADDKERLVGLLAAPIAGMIGLLVTGSLLANDPSVHLSNGQINKLHVNPSLYVELGAVALALAVVMLAMAWFRKRVYLGITMALYGLSIFNLHFWGFGIPYIIAGAWYLVRAYRLQTKLKEARAAEAGPASAGPASAGPGGRPGASKRYTPPAAPPGKSPKPKPGNQRKAG